jgi:hypothetical protein
MLCRTATPDLEHKWNINKFISKVGHVGQISRQPARAHHAKLAKNLLISSKERPIFKPFFETMAPCCP